MLFEETQMIVSQDQIPEVPSVILLKQIRQTQSQKYYKEQTIIEKQKKCDDETLQIANLKYPSAKLKFLLFQYTIVYS